LSHPTLDSQRPCWQLGDDWLKRCALRDVVDLHHQAPLAELLLQAGLASGERERSADFDHHVPWNWHLLTCLRHTLRATVTLLAGARAVNVHPHFHFSPLQTIWDPTLGSVQRWPPTPVLLLLDCYEPSERETEEFSRRQTTRVRSGYCGWTDHRARRS
jgi:hypothetical protein